MKHIFILNPAAGSKNMVNVLSPKIKDASEKLQIPVEIYYTKKSKDAEYYVRNQLENSNGELIRFYAGGGDGTLCEVVNGAYGFKNAEIACIPFGTGNDFVRNFSNSQLFMNFENQLLGTARKVDLLCCNNRHSINMINIGFDCDVVTEASILKKKGFAGAMAYLIGVFIILVKKYGKIMTVRFDGQKLVDGEMLLCAVANGSYCGGGFRSAAAASLNDGVFNAYLIHKVSRFRFLTLLKKYRDGTYVNVKSAKTFIDNEQCKKIEISGKGPVQISCDGELLTYDKVCITMEPEAISFSIPKGCELMNDSSMASKKEALKF